MSLNTTIKNKPVAFDFNKLAEEWGKPKSLLEIFRLVEKFPFKAKAVAVSSGTFAISIPVGAIIELTGFTNSMDRFVTTWRKPGAPADIYFVVNSGVKRWLLVED